MIPRAIRAAQDWLPPKLLNVLRGRFGNRFQGNYPNWLAAEEACGGYDDESIVEQAARSARAVADGTAVYERDGVVFDQIEYSWPTLASLLFVATQSHNSLRVLDFGGALGTSYRQNVKFLSRLNQLSWAVVEQEGFVAIGKREFETNQLRFFSNVKTAAVETHPNVILLSGVLQYLPEPGAFLDSILDEDVDFLVLDRTPLIDGDVDRLTIQRVPRHIYTASYPAWFFARDRLIARIRTKYALVEEFPAADRANIPARYAGFLWQRARSQ